MTDTGWKILRVNRTWVNESPWHAANSIAWVFSPQTCTYESVEVFSGVQFSEKWLKKFVIVILYFTRNIPVVYFWNGVKLPTQNLILCRENSMEKGLKKVVKKRHAFDIFQIPLHWGQYHFAVKTFGTFVYNTFHNLHHFIFDNCDKQKGNNFKISLKNSALDFRKNNTSSSSPSEGIVFDKIQGIIFNYYIKTRMNYIFWLLR